MIHLANCKINIGLNILNKREDGFHNLSTIMYPLKGLCDVLEVVHSDAFKFSSTGLTIDCDNKDNLCVKAYNLLFEEFGLTESVHLHLHKIVPFGAGLGGGSADATFVLRAVSELVGLSVTSAKLKELAARLGSDTAFFIDNVPQLCSGRGEITESIDLSLKGYCITVVKPQIFISTKEAFSGITPKQSEFDLRNIVTLPLSRWRDCVVNDFENHLFKIYPQLEQIKNKLYDLGATYASMSGSGSALYAISEHPIEKKSFDNDVFFHSYVEK
ncbi:MAG: 4-(cytidine 5'-diphospho)-2-C-methyl-D-erythritol kinase [Rikenellaceae bacterium]